MANEQVTAPQAEPDEWESGGLRFQVHFRGEGPTTHIYVRDGKRWVEALRFDDFANDPHYHAPASGPPIAFDRNNGEPLAWFVSRIDHHLGELLEKSGYTEQLTDIDLGLASENAKRVEQDMISCVPEGFVREPGFGLRKVTP